MSDMRDAFDLHTISSKLKGGYRIRCRLGLWAVDAPDREIALREARHYFAQYYADGEYERRGGEA